jgi:hypothetical protein
MEKLSLPADQKHDAHNRSAYPLLIIERFT